jgi:thymidine kinase
MMSKLYFRYGAMNSGKTTALLQVAHNYEEKGMRVLLMKPAIDTKGDNLIVSRLGISRPVDILLTKEDTIIKYLPDTDIPLGAIIVDEAQFLTPEQVNELYFITKALNIPILCYGLRCDFQMKGFPGSTRLLEIADSLEELKTICSCGKKATQNLRLVNNKPVFEGEQISIDNQDEIKYDSVCGDCYLKLRGEIKNV